MKKVCCFLLILAVVLGLCGCRKAEESLSHREQDAVSEKSRDDLTLLYCNGDSLNPYAARTEVNRQLGALLYEPLVRVNDRFEPEYRLAQSVAVDGKNCTVVLKEIAFWDGSAVTADDVVYSYQLAKASAEYAAALYEVQSASSTDGKTVLFRLTQYDPYFANLLDFPVIKAGSEKQTDADGVILPPVGCGRYCPDGNAALKRNEGYYGEKSRISSIQLINAPDRESVSHYVEVGAVDLYFTDIADGNIVRMSGKRLEVNMNHLVYLGINGAISGLSEPYLRYAISSALDRSEICNAAYFNNATPAEGFFHPDFGATKSLQTIKKSADLQIAIENLGKIGYNNLDREGYRCNAGGKPLTLTLLVNNDNPSRLSAARMIVRQLKAAGIAVSLLERDYASYVAAVQANQFQLYLGEVKILNNMDFTQLVVPGGSAAFGVTPRTATSEETVPTENTEPQPTPLSDIIAGFYSGTQTVSDLAGALLTEMPVIPVCYRKGLLFYSADLRSVTSATPSDLFLSMAQF